MKWSELGVKRASQLREQSEYMKAVADEGHLEPEQRQRLLRIAKALYDAAERFINGEDE